MNDLRVIPEPCPAAVETSPSVFDLKVSAERRTYACRWFIAGYTVKEIASAMEVSINRVLQILRKGGAK